MVFGLSHHNRVRIQYEFTQIQEVQTIYDCKHRKRNWKELSREFKSLEEGTLWCTECDR